MKEQTWKQWVRAVQREKKDNPNHPSKLGKSSMAALTGTDYRVLDAFVSCLKVYQYTSEQKVLDAARILLAEMQLSTRWIARELIPFVMNWEDRERLWPLVVPQQRYDGPFYPSGDCADHTGYEDMGTNPLGRPHP